MPKGMVVCPHHLASTAGLNVLSRGGNAVDAAIAVQAALSVVYPHMTGLGGDGFWLGYHSESQRIYGLNGSGRAGATCDRDRLPQPIPQRGPQAVITVPGGVAAWGEMHQRFGSLPWADLLQPAIALAAEGYPVSGSQAHWTRVNQAHLTAYGGKKGGLTHPFLPGGTSPAAGAMITNLPLAETLRHLAAAGPEDIYRGDLAQRLTTFLGEVGSPLTAADFAHHQSTWVEPISTP
jgi:gamma-glutamyltranspeptidase